MDHFPGGIMDNFPVKLDQGWRTGGLADRRDWEAIHDLLVFPLVLLALAEYQTGVPDCQTICRRNNGPFSGGIMDHFPAE